MTDCFYQMMNCNFASKSSNQFCLIYLSEYFVISHHLQREIIIGLLLHYCQGSNSVKQSDLLKTFEFYVLIRHYYPHYYYVKRSKLLDLDGSTKWLPGNSFKHDTSFWVMTMPGMPGPYGNKPYNNCFFWALPKILTLSFFRKPRKLGFVLMALG